MAHLAGISTMPTSRCQNKEVGGAGSSIGFCTYSVSPDDVVSTALKSIAGIPCYPEKQCQGYERKRG
jgi:hypothetical protein